MGFEFAIFLQWRGRFPDRRYPPFEVLALEEIYGPITDDGGTVLRRMIAAGTIVLLILAICPSHPCNQVRRSVH
jgi:hypothetical protein